ncbi:MAG TPA: diguanylate cyclase response regulator [Desulfovibrio sp.]|nr:diguanylate cyclase response regulator [Desulfovibrio sp.]
MDAMNASGVPHQSRPPREGMLLSSDEAFVETVTSLWPEDVMHWQVLRSGRAALDIMFVTPPDLLVVDMRLADLPGDAVLRILKSENVYRQICAVLCMDEATLHGGMDWATTEADDFVLLPATVVELRARLELAMLRATRTLDANPLTHLPGNTSILLDIQTRIDRGEDFGLGYADLDNFKAFNDKYGFSRGDEALMMTARIIVNTVRAVASGSSSFVGHVGGDDFVFMLPAALMESACRTIVSRFDAIVPSFYDDDDRARGCIVSTDRQGDVRTFPLMAISIAVVFNHEGCLQHAGEASHRAGQMKKKAKSMPGSSYALDRRCYGDAPSADGTAKGVPPTIPSQRDMCDDSDGMGDEVDGVDGGGNRHGGAHG